MHAKAEQRRCARSLDGLMRQTMLVAEPMEAASRGALAPSAGA